MKQMNLIPQEIKQKRKNTTYKKIGAIASLIPVGIMAQGYISMNLMKSNIQDLNGDIAQANSLKQQIEAEEKLIEKNRSILINLTSGGLPLNQFLLFTGITLPEDVRLYSISSESVFEEEKEAETKSDEAVAEVVEELMPAEGEESTETQAPVEEVVVEEKKDNIIIKGAALNVDSIGTFMNNLENKNDYILNVDISDVQNFYNGAFNYKLFEIIVELKN